MWLGPRRPDPARAPVLLDSHRIALEVHCPARSHVTHTTQPPGGHHGEPRAALRQARLAPCPAPRPAHAVAAKAAAPDPRIKMSASTLGLHWQTHNRTAFEGRAAMAIDTGERVHVERTGRPGRVPGSGQSRRPAGDRLPMPQRRGLRGAVPRAQHDQAPGQLQAGLYRVWSSAESRGENPMASRACERSR